MDNLIWFTINNYRNIVGAYLELAAMPRFLNLYEEKFKLDLRLSLLNIMIEADKKPLGSIITLEKYRNSYTGETPKILGSQVCYQLSEIQVCLERNDE